MPRHAWAIAGLFVVILHGALSASAQEASRTGQRPRPRGSLADRIGNFGRSLVGATPATTGQPPRGTAAPRPRSGSATPLPMPPTAEPSATDPSDAAGPESMVSSPAPRNRSSRRTAQPNYPGPSEAEEPLPPRRSATNDAPVETETMPADASESTPVETVENESAAETEPVDFGPVQRGPTSRRGAARGNGLRGVGSSALRDGAAATATSPVATESADGASDATSDSTGAELPSSGEAAAEASQLPADLPVARTARSGRPLRRETREDEESGDEVLIVQQSPLLDVQTAGPRRIKVGQRASYRVRLRNSGDAPAHEVVVTVRLPDWAELVDMRASQGQAHQPGQGEAGDGVQWLLSEAGAQSDAELVLDLIPHKSRPLDLNVQWTHSPVSTQAQVEVQEAKLVMAISGPDEVPFGQQETYKLTLSNPGTGDAEQVVVRLLPTTPGETETTEHRIGRIEAGQTKTVELELTARDPGQLVISAEATGDGGLQAAATTEVLVRRADLHVELVGPRKMFAGTVASYKILLANPGNAPARGVELSAVAPPGAKFLAASDGGRIEAGEAKVVWRLASLKAGAQFALSVKCRLETPGPNRPQVVCVAEDNLKDTAAVTTEVDALADLVLNVRDPSGPVPVGEDADYEIHIQNRGKKAADDVECVAFFSDGIEPMEADGLRFQIGPGQVVFERIPSIDAGQEIVLIIRARATQAGDHVFRAQVRCQSLNSTLAGEETTRYYDVTGDAVDSDNAETTNYNGEQDDTRRAKDVLPPDGTGASSLEESDLPEDAPTGE